LDLDDGLGGGELLGQPLVLRLRRRQRGGAGRNGRRPASSAGRQARQRPRFALPAPGGRLRGIQAFPPQECAQLALGTAVRLPEDAQLVGGRQRPPPRSGGHFRIRRRVGTVAGGERRSRHEVPSFPALSKTTLFLGAAVSHPILTDRESQVPNRWMSTLHSSLSPGSRPRRCQEGRAVLGQPPITR